MSKRIYAILCLAGALALPHVASADGFEPAGFRNLARTLGLNLGQGYHAVPCQRHLAQHYNRSALGMTHPAHRLTPIHRFNTQHMGVVGRMRGCDNYLPYFKGNSMPPVTAPARIPHHSIQQQPTVMQPMVTPGVSDTEVLGDDDSDDDTETQNEDSTSDDDYKIERLPRLEDEAGTGDEFGTDGGSDDIELEGDSAFNELQFEDMSWDDENDLFEDQSLLPEDYSDEFSDEFEFRE